MKNKFLVIVALVFIVTACDNDKNSQQEEKNQQKVNEFFSKKPVNTGSNKEY